MAEFDTVIRGGMVIDGTRLPRYQADVGIKDGKIAKIGNLKSHEGKEGHRCRRADRRARLRRSAYPLRCAAFLGSVLLDFELARRHLGRDRQLRLRLRAGQARPARPRDAHDDAHRGDSLCLDEGRIAVGLGHLSRIPRQRRSPSQGHEPAALRADGAGHDLGYGPRRGQVGPYADRGRDQGDVAASSTRRWIAAPADGRRSASDKTASRPTLTAPRWSPT